jgi:hypothetical protein
MTAQMAKIKNEKNAKIEMLETKIEMLENKIEILENKIELFNTKTKIEIIESNINLLNTKTNIETKIPAKKAKIESKNIIANKTYISTYFIMITFIMIVYILFNERKDDVNQLIKKILCYY